MGYTPEQKELLDAMQIMIDDTLNSQVTKIYSCIINDVGNNKRCTITLNRKTHTVQYYGETPIVNQQYRVFVPFDNMSQAFIITGGGGGQEPTTGDYSQLTNKPSVNSIVLSGNKTSSELGLYGTGNEPDYPVDSVNGKTGAVVLTSSDVGALPNSTVIPTQTSQLTNNSGFITSAGAPVQSINGKVGNVVLGAGDVGALPSSVVYVESVNGETGIVEINKTTVGLGSVDDVKQYSASNPPPYPVQSVSGKTGVVVLTKNDVGLSNVDNVKQYSATNPPPYPVVSVNGKSGSVELGPEDVNALPSETVYVSSINGFDGDVVLSVPTKTSDLDNDSGYVTATTAPVRSVNSQIGDVVLTQDNVGNGGTYVRTENNFTNVEKIKLDGIATGAQVNVIEFVKRNGVTLTATGKAVDIVVPTKTSEVTNDSSFITSAQAPVQSVNGLTGAVSLNTDNLPPTVTRRYVPSVPVINPETSFLNGNGTFSPIAVSGSVGFGNVFLSNVNSSISTYKTLNYISDVSSTEKSVTCTSASDVLSAVYLAEAQIDTNVIDAGIWNSSFYMKVSHVGGGESQIKIVCFLRHTNGTETELFTRHTSTIASTDYNTYHTETNRQQFSCAPTDRLGLRIYGHTTRNSSTTITYQIGGTNGSFINTPLALRHTQLRDLNGDSNYQHITTTQVAQIGTNATNIITLQSGKLDTGGNGSNVTATFTESSTSDNIASGSTLSVLFGRIQKAINNLIAHIANIANPHNVTKSQVGLGSVDNVKQYSSSNPPPYPITSFNSRVGAVVPASGDYSASQIAGLKNAIDTNEDVSANTSKRHDAVTIGTANGLSLTGQAISLGISSTTNAGAMSSADKKKLDDIQAGANNYALPIATSAVLGGIKSGNDVVVNATTGNVVVSNSDKLDEQEGTYYLNRANHTGTQLATTISNFAATVRSTVLTGLSVATNAVITATDTVLTSLGKLQAQITAHIDNKSNPHEVTVTQIGAVPTSRTVNGKALSSNITLSASDVGALPSTAEIPDKTSDLINDSDFLPVVQTAPANGQIVAYDGTKWVNQNPASYSQQQANWSEANSGSVQFIQNKPTALSQFSNDSGFITSVQAPVQSVAGKIGVVTLAKSDVGLGNVDNTADANKNVLSASKLTTSRTIALSGDVTGSVSFNGSANATITATVVDDSHNHVISNVDNLQTALNAKAPLASPALTGTPKAPTATAGTNTTQIATTAFVTSAVSSAGGNVTYLSATAPTSPKTGDTWYQIL